MNNQYNVWNYWDPLQTVVLGDCYPPEFFSGIKNDRIRSALDRIVTETLEDLDYYEKVLRDFGCTVLRPKINPTDNITNYINHDGKIKSRQGVPRSPLMPRDTQVVIGNQLLYTGVDHRAIKDLLTDYNQHDNINIQRPLSREMFNRYRTDAADWPTYEEYLGAFSDGKFLGPLCVQEEFRQIHAHENFGDFFPVDAPSISVIGSDLYLDRLESSNIDITEENYYIDSLKKLYPNFRHNYLSIGGHNDGSFHTIKEGAILSLYEIQTYEETFPGWDVCYLPNESYNKVEGFRKIKEKVAGKWWVPGEEDNDEFTYFVETWLNDWVGYVEESVFDVNVLSLDDKHVCVSNMNDTVISFLKKHKMEAVHVPWRHRYFWDGGLHCITLELYRNGTQNNYFPNRKNTIYDKGF